MPPFQGLHGGVLPGPDPNDRCGIIFMYVNDEIPKMDRLGDKIPAKAAKWSMLVPPLS